MVIDSKYEVHSIWHSAPGTHNDSDNLLTFNKTFRDLVNQRLKELVKDEWEIISIEYTLTSLDNGWMAKEAFFYTVRYE